MCTKKRISKLLCLFVIIAFAVVITGCGGTSSTQSSTSQQEDAPEVFGSLRGEVVQAEGLQPLENATIVVNDQATVTGKDGLFSLHGIPEGEYDISVTKPGYAVYKGAVKISSTKIVLKQIVLTPDAILDYDVIIVGAGTGGVSAAMQAAKIGARTAVIEESDWIGGQMTAAGVTSLDEGPYLPSHRSGLYLEFYDRLTTYYKKMGKSTGTAYHSAQSTAFEPAIGQKILYKMIHDITVQTKGSQKPVLDMFLKARVVGAIITDNNVLGVVMEDGSKIQSKVVIDATEYGDFLPLTPARYRAGNSTSDNLNFNANINPITWTAVIRKHPNGADSSLQMSSFPPAYSERRPYFRNWIRNNGQGDGWYLGNGINYLLPMSFDFLSAWRGMPDSNNGDDYDASFNNYRKISKTGINTVMNDQPVNVMYLEDRAYRKKINCAARLKTLQIIYYFQHDLDRRDWSIATDEGYETAYNMNENHCSSIPREFDRVMANFPVIPYVRESRRAIGVMTMNAEDIRRDGRRAYKRYKTVVAVGDYPFDLHGADAQSDLDCGDKVSEISVDFGKAGGAFQIPFEVFIPEKVNGLLVAEKNISVSRLVQSAIRLQPVTIMTGQAVGAIAALSVKHGVQPRDLDPSIVQQVLVENGCKLSIDD